MVDFRGLDDVVVKLENEITGLTTELDNVKKEIERIKTEYHDESRLEEKSVREFILSWVVDNNVSEKKWRHAEEAKKEITELCNLSKRSVSAKSVLLCISDWKSTFNSSGEKYRIYLCDDQLIYGAVRTYPQELENYRSLNYEEISDITKHHDSSASIHEPGEYISVKKGDGEAFGIPLYEGNNADTLYNFLWDMYEFING